jgi:ferrous iron transport protein B
MPATAPKSRPAAASGYVVLTGNPNCGKTTIFNALTGLRAKVGNYAGVTVERKEGRLVGVDTARPLTVLDLPGTYSLSPKSLDEQISRDVLLNHLPEVPPADVVVVVVDASNLERNLYYATQVIELGHPTILALNMTDVAAENGHDLDAAQLARELGVPVVPMVGNTGQGLPELRAKIVELAGQPKAARPAPVFAELPEPFQREVRDLVALLRDSASAHAHADAAEAVLLLSDDRALPSDPALRTPQVTQAVAAARARLEAAGVDWRSAVIEARYARVAAIQSRVVTETLTGQDTFSDKLDRVFTHKLWGMAIFVGIMALMFQSIFSFAELPMTLLEQGVAWVGGQVGNLIPPGALHDLLIDGVIAGVGAVVVFLPQICLLFLFIGLLEDTGYMARAAFLMDRLMSKVGLHGKSFIPMLSSFACAIPGIMATRTIESPKDRLVTILVAPLMSCSARLPVYTLLIGACIADRKVAGVFGLQGLTMLSMYLLGIVVALLMAWLFKKTLLKGETPMLIMELPPYKRPVLRVVARHMWDRSKLFLRRAGTVILGISIILWFLATYPKSTEIEQSFEQQRTTLKQQFAGGAPASGPAAPATAGDASAATGRTPAPPLPAGEGRGEGERPGLAKVDPPTTEQRLQLALAELDRAEAGEKLRHSFAGRLGRALEPIIAPLGFDWKIGIGVVASFAAREVFVSTMSTVYNVGGGDDEEATRTLAATLREQQRADGTTLYTPLTAITLMVFYVFALQCVSTVAVVRRETNSWKWPFFQWLYMGVLAWVLAFVTWHGGRLLGFE